MQQHHDYSSSYPVVPWGWHSIGAVLALIIAYFLGIVLLRILGVFQWLGVQPGLSSPILYLISVGLFVLMILAIYLVVARRYGWKALGVHSAPWWSFALIPPLFLSEMFGIIMINRAIIELQGNFENPQVEAITGGKMLDIPTFLLLLLLIAVIGPIAEELFFRGMLYPLLRQRLGSDIAILLSAVCFSAAHLIPVLFPALFFVGLVLALLREWSGSTVPCIGLHMLQNGFMITLLYVAPLIAT